MRAKHHIRKPVFRSRNGERFTDSVRRWRKKRSEWRDAVVMLECEKQIKRRNQYRAFYGLTLNEICV